MYGLEISKYWKLIVGGLENNTPGEYALTVKDERFRIEKLGSSSNLKFVYGDLPLSTVINNALQLFCTLYSRSILF